MFLVSRHVLHSFGIRFIGSHSFKYHFHSSFLHVVSDDLHKARANCLLHMLRTLNKYLAQPVTLQLCKWSSSPARVAERQRNNISVARTYTAEVNSICFPWVVHINTVQSNLLGLLWMRLIGHSEGSIYNSSRAGGSIRRLRWTHVPASWLEYTGFLRAG